MATVVKNITGFGSERRLTDRVFAVKHEGEIVRSAKGRNRVFKTAEAAQKVADEINGPVVEVCKIGLSEWDPANCGCSCCN